MDAARRWAGLAGVLAVLAAAVVEDLIARCPA